MHNQILENLIFIDIETVSEQSSFHNLSTEWQQVWEEKINRVLPENTAIGEYYEQRAAVMAEFAKVVCISMGYFVQVDGVRNLRIKSFYDSEETDLLNNFIQTLDQIEIKNKHWAFAGHNIKEFDIPFICRRLLINGIRIPKYLNFQNMKPWETNMVDTFQYWRFGDYKNYTSLRLLAAALKVPSPKDDIDGSKVGEVYWKLNELKRIVLYCQKDVVTVANIILRFSNNDILTDNQVVFVS